jgi:hypothetical protein
LSRTESRLNLDNHAADLRSTFMQRGVVHPYGQPIAYVILHSWLVGPVELLPPIIQIRPADPVLSAVLRASQPARSLALDMVGPVFSPVRQGFHSAAAFGTEVYVQ